MNFKGEKTLPNKERMQKEIKQKRLRRLSRYIHTPRHTTHEDWIDYMDEIASMIGCKPNCGI